MSNLPIHSIVNFYRTCRPPNGWPDWHRDCYWKWPFLLVLPNHSMVNFHRLIGWLIFHHFFHHSPPAADSQPPRSDPTTGPRRPMDGAAKEGWIGPTLWWCQNVRTGKWPLTWWIFMDFSRSTWWFSTAMLNNQKVEMVSECCFLWWMTMGETGDNGEELDDMGLYPWPTVDGM